MSFRVLLYFVYIFLSRQTPSGILCRGPPRPEVIQVINFSARYHCRLPSGSNNRRPFSMFYLVVHSITTRSLSPSNMVSVKRSEDGVLIVTDSGWHMRIEMKGDQQWDKKSVPVHGMRYTGPSNTPLDRLLQKNRSQHQICSCTLSRRCPKDFAHRRIPRIPYSIYASQH